MDGEQCKSLKHYLGLTQEFISEVSEAATIDYEVMDV
jgi:hypothetical protein